MSVYLHNGGYYRDTSGRGVGQVPGADFDLSNHQGSSFGGNQGNGQAGHPHRQAPPDHVSRTTDFVDDRQKSFGGSRHSRSSKSRNTKRSARDKANKEIARFDDKFNSNNSSTQQQPYAMHQASAGQQVYSGQPSYTAQQPYYTTQQSSANGQQAYDIYGNQYRSGA